MEIYKSSEITVHKLNELREEDKNIQILDVREDTERNHAHIKGSIHIKLTEIAKRHIELDKEKNIFLDLGCHISGLSSICPYWVLKARQMV